MCGSCPSPRKLRIQGDGLWVLLIRLLPGTAPGNSSASSELVNWKKLTGPLHLPKGPPAQGDCQQHR